MIIDITWTFQLVQTWNRSHRSMNHVNSVVVGTFQVLPFTSKKSLSFIKILSIPIGPGPEINVDSKPKYFTNFVLVNTFQTSKHACNELKGHWIKRNCYTIGSVGVGNDDSRPIYWLHAEFYVLDWLTWKKYKYFLAFQIFQSRLQ